MNSPRSTRTSENERSSDSVGSPRSHSDFVLPSSSTSDISSTYLPPPPPPRKRVLATTPLPTTSRAKRAIFAIDTQASGEEENVERVEEEQGQRPDQSPPTGRQYYHRNAKNVAAESLAKLHKSPKKD